MTRSPAVAVLAGGVGAARFLRGLVQVCRPEEIVAIVNTGDDVVLHGLHVSPDIDTVVYTLAGAIDPDRGWGLEGETWNAMDALDRYGGNTWFRLGDRDLATHLFRTQRLADGAGLAEITAEIARSWGLDLTVLPVSEDRVETRVTVEGEGEIGFQEYFVQRRHEVPVRGIRFAGAEEAKPAPNVIEAIEEADVLVIAPSNPLVSIGPLLAVPGVRDAVAARRDRTAAVSPIVGGEALKGPADRMLRELDHEATAVGVARLYTGLAAALVIDEVDRDLAAAVEAAGMRPIVTDTVMRDPDIAAALARTTLSSVARAGEPGLRGRGTQGTA